MTQALGKECLVIFTRYPEPGKTKTRLIPALGADSAARLQRQMTEHTLAQAKELQNFRSISVEVHFAGGTQLLMQDWLGCDITYREQSQGDIGQRMAIAFQSAFATGMTQVVIIGIDCPDLNTQLMAKAFHALKQHDLVLGPAEDGGYYLIGLRRLIPELFTGIPWSTAAVLQRTLSIAQKLELSVANLPLLGDVDRPEDLWLWNQVTAEN